MRNGAIGASILLIAVGAVMAYAVTATADGFDINAAGVILMIVGGIGLLVSLFMTLMSHDRVDAHTETRYIEHDRL